jgi:hypothetical protein
MSEAEEEKSFQLVVKLEFGNQVFAPTKEKAIEILKSQFQQDHNIVLKDEEIEEM